MVTRRRALHFVAGATITAGGLLLSNRRGGSAATPVLGHVSPGVPPGAPGPASTVIISPGPGKAAPTYIQGRLVHRDGPYLYVSTDSGDRVARVENGARVWRGGPVPLSGLETGDRLSITGSPDASGVLHATIIDANVAQVRGKLIGGSGTTWTVEDARLGRTWTVMVDPDARPEAMLAPGAGTNDPAQLRLGAFIWAIGVETADGTIRLTKLSVLG